MTAIDSFLKIYFAPQRRTSLLFFITTVFIFPFFVSQNVILFGECRHQRWWLLRPHRSSHRHSVVNTHASVKRNSWGRIRRSKENRYCIDRGLKRKFFTPSLPLLPRDYLNDDVISLCTERKTDGTDDKVEMIAKWNNTKNELLLSSTMMNTTTTTDTMKRSEQHNSQSISQLRAGGQEPLQKKQKGGGGGRKGGNLEKTVSTIIRIFACCLKGIVPPAVLFIRTVIGFYRTLPRDALMAQAGLVYCFAGGYYPTLFSTLQAAQHCGWNEMCNAIGDLTEEATKAIETAAMKPKEFAVEDEEDAKVKLNAADMITQKTMAVLAAVDPMKINQATGALYTTWMGVSSVLEKEYARTIALSLTIADYLQPLTQFVFTPPLQLCIPDEFHRWIPVILGWGCKATAMSLAWRVQRILSAGASAITGGLMFSRAVGRIVWRRRGWWKRVRSSTTTIYSPEVLHKDDVLEASVLDETIGFMIAGIGLYTQLKVGGLGFQVPFPLSLVTWPFDFAENWIQWQITKDAQD